MRHRRHNPKARVPFCNQIGRELHLSKGHVWAVCVGQRMSSDHHRILARQAELLAAASAAPSSAVRPPPHNLPAALNNPQTEHRCTTDCGTAGGDKRRRCTCGKRARRRGQPVSRTATSDGGQVDDQSAGTNLPASLSMMLGDPAPMEGVP